MSKPHHHKRAAAPGEWASRNRSYVVTLGLIFAAVALLVWKFQGADSHQWPVWKWVLLYAASALGLGFVFFGLLGRQGMVKKVATYTSLSWVTFPVSLLALPVQLVLSVFDRKR
jgi:hypothetical protein